MATSANRVVVDRSEDVVIVRFTFARLLLYCLPRPMVPEADIYTLVSALNGISGSSWLSRRRATCLMRRLGRVWSEGAGVDSWTNDLAKAIARSRAILGQLDLAGVGPLVPEICDEYDDIIFSLMGQVIVGDRASLQSWVEMAYEIDSTVDGGASIRSALRAVQQILWSARSR